ncbi:hypothetical protein JOM56_000128 [Amanita muscaria]
MAVDFSKISVLPLPTLANLNATVPNEVDAQRIASAWLDVLAVAVESDKPVDIGNLFLEESSWRDMLSLTWDFRTFHGISSITTFLEDRIKSTHPRSFKLRQEFLGLQRPNEDIAWINAFFDFETDIGIGFGVLRLVPTSSGEWKAYTVFTNLEGLKGFPEKIGALRNQEPSHGRWEEDRKRERDSEDGDPTVLIVGGGQSGLEISARLKAYGIKSLVVERNERIGDNWRNRYTALSLHDPVWYNQMPYLPFPSTWPVYAPSQKLANWLEHYAAALDLNVWTSSEVTGAIQDSNTRKWRVSVRRADRSTRVFNVNHLVLSTGFSSPKPKIPEVPGVFGGETLHSSQHKQASDYAGRKVVVIGSCVAAHDIAHDCYNHGVDVTMYQRSSTHVMTTKNGYAVLLGGMYAENGPSTDIADRVNASLPYFAGIGLKQQIAQKIAELDKELIDALNQSGFRTNQGIFETGLLLLAFSRNGGYYLDVGTSQLIADGRIKLKSDSQLKEFTKTGLLFEDGSELEADVAIFATGNGDIKDNIREICGDDVADRCPPLVGFDQEGELSGIARYLGTPSLWYLTGSLATCRFYSKHVALQIKAQEEGVFGSRYSLSS